MTRITYVRLRPAEEVNELWATTHRREGTTVVELGPATADAAAGCLAGGLLPVSIGLSAAEPVGWVVNPQQALELAEASRADTWVRRLERMLEIGAGR